MLLFEGEFSAHVKSTPRSRVAPRASSCIARASFKSTDTMPKVNPSRQAFYSLQYEYTSLYVDRLEPWSNGSVLSIFSRVSASLETRATRGRRHTLDRATTTNARRGRTDARVARARARVSRLARRARCGASAPERKQKEERRSTRAGTEAARARVRRGRGTSRARVR